MTGEFDFIEKMLTPLAGAQALGLKDDAAWLADEQLVITKDVLVAGTHFLPDDPPDLIARKALRVNISDLTAKGAQPLFYFLGLVLPAKMTESALQQFVDGLRQDQTTYGLALAGGDTTRHQSDGPLMISITLVGKPHALPIWRNGAAPDDVLMVTGTIGDAMLGLLARQGKILEMPEDMHAPLISAYQLPVPPVALAETVGKTASAAIDVSDGLLADAGHLAKASKISVAIHADKIPLSVPAQRWLDTQPDKTAGLLKLLNAGDDYQTLLSVPAARKDDLLRAAHANGVLLHEIGACGDHTAESMFVFADGRSEPLAEHSTGYDHFQKRA